MAFKGLEDFFSVVDLLNNPDKYKSKVEELKALTASYTEAIEAVVKLADVNDYTENIRYRNELSIKELEKAKEEATNIRGKATEFANKVKKDISEKERTLSVKEQSFDSRKKDIEKKEKEISKGKFDLEKEKIAFQKEKQDFLEEKRIHNEKIKKLAEAMQ